MYSNFKMRNICFFREPDSETPTSISWELHWDLKQRSYRTMQHKNSEKKYLFFARKFSQVQIIFLLETLFRALDFWVIFGLRKSTAEVQQLKRRTIFQSICNVLLIDVLLTADIRRRLAVVSDVGRCKPGCAKHCWSMPDRQWWR